MASVSVRRQAGEAVPCAVVASDGAPVPEIVDCLAHLVAGGRATCALGLAHFLSWLGERGTDLDAIDIGVLEAYAVAFRFGAKTGAASVQAERAGQLHPVTRKPYATVERQPRTVNHRLSVLSSFSSFLIERDTRAGSGRWRGQMNPVPASGGGMGTHGSPGRDAPVGAGEASCVFEVSVDCPGRSTRRWRNGWWARPARGGTRRC
jgi:hypothetical protein